MKALKTVLCSLIILSFAACDSNTTFRSSVPTYPVQFEINILAEYPHFVTGNGFQTLTFTQQRYYQDALGYAGLLVWVGMDEQYHAADLCCPHCVNTRTAVEVDGFYAKCPNCGEEYDLSFGIANPTKGISKEMLRKYSTAFNGTKLTIRQSY